MITLKDDILFIVDYFTHNNMNNKVNYKIIGFDNLCDYIKSIILKENENFYIINVYSSPSYKYFSISYSKVIRLHENYDDKESNHCLKSSNDITYLDDGIIYLSENDYKKYIEIIDLYINNINYIKLMKKI